MENSPQSRTTNVSNPINTFQNGIKIIAASNSANRCGSAQFREEVGSFIVGEHSHNRAIEQNQSIRYQSSIVYVIGLGWTRLELTFLDEALSSRCFQIHVLILPQIPKTKNLR